MEELLMLDLPSIWAAAVTTAGVGVTAWKGIPFLRRVGHVLDDIQGEAPRPGLPDGRPGMLTRLDRLEEGMVEVRAQVTINSGSSLKDIAIETRNEVGSLKSTLSTNTCDDCPARTVTVPKQGIRGQGQDGGE